MVCAEAVCRKWHRHKSNTSTTYLCSPLEGIDEQMSIYEPPARSGGTPRRRQVHSVIEGATLNNYLNGVSQH